MVEDTLKATKAYSIYSLALHRKSLPTPLATSVKPERGSMAENSKPNEDGFSSTHATIYYLLAVGRVFNV